MSPLRVIQWQLEKSEEKERETKAIYLTDRVNLDKTGQYLEPPLYVLTKH